MFAGSALLSAARLVDDGKVIDDGWLLVDDGCIVRRGVGRPPATEADTFDLDGRYLTPGFVDIHVHGGGGHSGETGAAAITGMARFHRTHGTTSVAVSLGTAPLEDLVESLRAVRRAAEQDVGILGSHLEGPFLGTRHRGAHPLSLLLEPTDDLIGQLLDAAGGTIRQITIAPERFSDELLDRLLGSGIRVAVGHTSASMAQVQAAMSRGASILTHAFNGMPGIQARAPGPVVAALNSGAMLEVIADGVHVDPAVISMLFTLAPDRVILVSDAISAAGAPDGEYPLGGQSVTVREGVARIGVDGSLAGSTLTLGRAVQVCVEAGVPLAVAIRAATKTPAVAIGAADIGVLDIGARADFVELDDALVVRQVWMRGRRV